MRNLTSQRSVRIWLAIENGNGHEVEQAPPISPLRQLPEIVRPDQPYELAFSIAFQSSNRIHRILRTELSFQVRDNDLGMTGGHLGGGCHTGWQIGHSRLGFQGVLR